MRQRGSVLMYALLALAILAAIASLIWWADENIETSAGVRKGSSEKQAEWDAANEKARTEEAAKGNAAATKLEEKRHASKIVYRTITKEVDKVVVEYRDRPCLDDRGLHITRCAIQQKSGDSCKPAGPVPAVKPSG